MRECQFTACLFILSSALDAESEFLVQDALEKLMLDRTVITIAHRLSTIRSANQIAVLDLGVVAELGPYQELLKIENGIFRKLVERQTIVQWCFWYLKVLFIANYILYMNQNIKKILLNLCLNALYRFTVEHPFRSLL